MEKGPGLHRRLSHGGQIVSKSRIFLLQQELHAPVFKDGPQVPDHPFLRIEGKEVRQAIDIWSTRIESIPLRHPLRQGPKKRHIDSIRSKLHVPDLMRQRDRIASSVLVLHRKPVHDRRQVDNRPFGFHFQSRPLRRIGQGFNLHGLAADHVAQQLQRARHLSKRYVIGRLFDRAQRLRGFKSKICAGPFRAVVQHFHAATEPRVKGFVPAFRSVAQTNHLRSSTKIFHRHGGIPFGKQPSVSEDFHAPFHRRQERHQPRRFRQKGQGRFRRLIRKGRAHVHDVRVHLRIRDFSDQAGTRAKEFQNPHVIGFAQTILRDQFHAEGHPGTHLFQSQHFGHPRTFPDKLDAQHVIPIRQFPANLRPLGQVGL